MHLTGHGFYRSIVLETDKPCIGEVIPIEKLTELVTETIKDKASNFNLLFLNICYSITLG